MFFDSDRSIAHVTASVDEGDHFGGILFEGLVGNLLAVIQESIHVLQHRNITASLLKQHRIEMAMVADDNRRRLRFERERDP